MLKAQDVVLLLKLLAHPDHLDWSQSQLALHLCISVSEVNAGLKRLKRSGLVQLHAAFSEKRYLPVLGACEELLISGIRYIFYAELGEPTAGIATSYAAPIFEKHIVMGQDPIPVWPYAKGDRRGFALEPLYSSVPQSVAEYPDQAFYDLLVLVDALRQGRARERSIAVKFLRERLSHDKQK